MKKQSSTLPKIHQQKMALSRKSLPELRNPGEKQKTKRKVRIVSENQCDTLRSWVASPLKKIFANLQQNLERIKNNLKLYLVYWGV